MLLACLPASPDRHGQSSSTSGIEISGWHRIDLLEFPCIEQIHLVASPPKHLRCLGHPNLLFCGPKRKRGEVLELFFRSGIAELATPFTRDRPFSVVPPRSVSATPGRPAKHLLYEMRCTPTNRSSCFSHACPKRQAWHTSSAPKSCGSNKLEKPFVTTDRTGTGGNVDRPGCGGWIAVQRGESVSAPMPAACRSENRRYAPTRPLRPLPSK